jgi:hypothetical protein
MYYGAWPVFVHSLQVGIIVAFVLLPLLVGALLWAEHRAESETPKREKWYSRETVKLRTLQRHERRTA